MATYRPSLVETNNDLDLQPSIPETLRAVSQLSSGKAPEPDATPAETYERGDRWLMEKLKRYSEEVTPEPSSSEAQGHNHRPSV
ncbi:unnamed protein product [Schistocephalus solidus]|uniref:Uncharacterized protein n=1 Tax=Schistocephalus solidus TaxID=70667 RepID=A0A183SD55_SCHSO|nr:unnamed protein product [Schistocephalus solidus]